MNIAYNKFLNWLRVLDCIENMYNYSLIRKQNCLDQKVNYSIDLRVVESKRRLLKYFCDFVYSFWKIDITEFSFVNMRNIYLIMFKLNGKRINSKWKKSTSFISLRMSEANDVPTKSHIWVASTTFKEL